MFRNIKSYELQCEMKCDETQVKEINRGEAI